MYIRDYENGDCRETAELFYDTVHKVNRKDYSEEQLRVWAPENRGLKQWGASFSGKKAMVAMEKGKIVGFCDVTDSGYLDRLYVHSGFQGMGIGRALCCEAEKFAASHSDKTVTVHASITAVPFFEKLGYAVIRQNKVIKEGVELINFLMEKRL